MDNANQQLQRVPARSTRRAAAFLLRALAAALLVCAPVGARAQDGDRATLDHLPTVRHLAAALSDPDSRVDTLFTMVVVAQTIENLPALEWTELQAATEQFRDDRAWLDRLAGRYLEIPMRSTVFDPVAWLIVQELGRQDLQATTLVSPLGPELDVLLRQLFDRSGERLATTLLPEVLVRMEYLAPGLWRSLRENAAGNETLLALVAGLDADWFDPWTAAEPPAPSAGDEDVLVAARRELTALADTALLPAPPDERALKQIRFSLLTAEAGDDAHRQTEAAYVLRLAAGIESLQQGQHLSFVESLLWVVADILSRAESGQAEASPMAALLSDLLPRISNNYARAFADVDPRINAGLAAAYDVVLNLRGGNPGSARIKTLNRNMADAVAQVVLMVPDMDYYFGQPVRLGVVEQIDICVGIAAARTPEGERTLTRAQFDRCMRALAGLVDQQARSAELSGDANGPFGAEYLARELSLPPWQRINYVLGYMHDRFSATCQLPAEPLTNPLEWAALATLMAWFAERAPVYFQTPENQALVVRMRDQGTDILRQLSNQADCFSGAGGGMNDPVSRSIQDYDEALLDLVNGIRETELQFRSEHLLAGADVVLGSDANQRTSYRSEGLVINACDAERSCGMTDKLEATRALVGLFPDVYLIADQSGLGKVEICYDNIEWLNRRSEPVRPDDPFVANYYGHLAFEVKGRYVENDTTFDVFGSRFVSPEEYHYLFAAQDPEILEDSCPLEHVGKQIQATLGSSSRFRIVPDRLTYLTSARNRPSRVLAANWGQGAEWRDWFVTGIGVTAMEFDGDPRIADRVSQHLQSLYQTQQAMVYSALLNPSLDGASAASPELYELMQAATNRKTYIRAVVSLFYPSLLLDSDDIRGALAGQGGLLDEEVLARLWDANVAVSTLGERGSLRLEEFRADWSRLPEDVRRSGSVDNSVAHALTRLNALYREFFGIREEQPSQRGMQF